LKPHLPKKRHLREGVGQGRIRKMGKPKFQTNRTRLFAEELLMCVVRLEPLEGTSQESGSIMRRMDSVGTNDQEKSQKLKQAKLSITKLYQENRELRQQLATKTMEASVAQGCEGNMTWLKRWL
jgi:hypothetical protein